MPQTLRPVVVVPKHEDLVAVKQLIESGAVTPVIDRTYPLSGVADATRSRREGHVHGKTVVTI